MVNNFDDILFSRYDTYTSIYSIGMKIITFIKINYSIGKMIKLLARLYIADL